MMKIIAAAAALSLIAPVAAQAQQDREQRDREQQDRDRQEQRDTGRRDALDKAGRIATQPAKDVGMDKAEIPPVLAKAVENPYAPAPVRTCKGLSASIKELNGVLGEDFTAGREANENRTGKIAEAVGKTVINSLIPFRGLVREISGAAPAERRLEAAVSAGIARRGFLRGQAVAKGCKI